MANEDQDQDQSQWLVFPGDQEDWEDTPQEVKDHMPAAFKHAAGLGPHPGKKKLELLRRDSDQRQDRSIPTDSDRQRAAEEPLE